MAARATSPRSRLFTATIRGLSAKTDAAVLLDLEGTVLFLNDAWERLARRSGCSSSLTVGSPFAESVQGEEPRTVLRDLLGRVARSTDGRPVTVTSELNSPDVARLVTTQVSPLVAGTEPIGLTVVQRVVRELPAGEVYPVVEGTLESYRGAGGELEQCCCCRRTRRPAEPAEWDFVPLLVAVPPRDAIFCYCPLCGELHRPAVGG
jgi:PAS domain-containing protein